MDGLSNRLHYYPSQIDVGMNVTLPNQRASHLLGPRGQKDFPIDVPIRRELEFPKVCRGVHIWVLTFHLQGLGL